MSIHESNCYAFFPLLYHAHWNVALEDTVRTQTRSQVWKAVFMADLGVNALFTTSLVW